MGAVSDGLADLSDRAAPYRPVTVMSVSFDLPAVRWGNTDRVDIIDLDADPLRQLAAWLDAARSAGEPMPEAMTIATATADGIPAARMVILRGLQRGPGFFTDAQRQGC